MYPVPIYEHVLQFYLRFINSKITFDLSLSQLQAWTWSSGPSFLFRMKIELMSTAVNKDVSFLISFLFEASVHGTRLASDLLTWKAVDKNVIDSETCQYKCLPKHIDKIQAVQFETV